MAAASIQDTGNEYWIDGRSCFGGWDMVHSSNQGGSITLSVTVLAALWSGGDVNEAITLCSGRLIRIIHVLNFGNRGSIRSWLQRVSALPVMSSINTASSVLLR
jgi:hypothetical protein